MSRRVVSFERAASGKAPSLPRQPSMAFLVTRASRGPDDPVMTVGLDTLCVCYAPVSLTSFLRIPFQVYGCDCANLGQCALTPDGQVH